MWLCEAVEVEFGCCSGSSGLFVAPFVWRFGAAAHVASAVCGFGVGGVVDGSAECDGFEVVDGPAEGVGAW